MSNYGSCPNETHGDPVIVVHPGRIGGQPTIGHSRLSASLVAETYQQHGLEQTQLMWDYLTEADVIVCCWYVARYGTTTERRRWKDWLGWVDDRLWTPRMFEDDEAAS